jgi:hypothetical protein
MEQLTPEQVAQFDAARVQLFYAGLQLLLAVGAVVGAAVVGAGGRSDGTVVT